MRVIGGDFRSRRLKTLPGLDVRPTPDRLRETLFNVLAPRIEGSLFVDAYAGSGAVGIEALSRGAARAILIERSPRAAGLIAENLAALGLTGRAEMIRGAAVKTLERLGSRLGEAIVFLDPPYPLEREYEAALTALSGLGCGLVIAQADAKQPLAEHYGALHRTRVLKQGSNVLAFYAPAEEANTDARR
jgi:16S rRNA (guanine966-N2)-methyltransferase